MSKRVPAKLSFGGIGGDVVLHGAHPNSARVHAFSFRREMEKEPKSARAEAGVQMRLGYVKLNDSDNFEVAEVARYRSQDTTGVTAYRVTGVLSVGRLIDNLILGDPVLLGIPQL